MNYFQQCQIKQHPKHFKKGLYEWFQKKPFYIEDEYFNSWLINIKKLKFKKNCLIAIFVINTCSQ